MRQRETALPWISSLDPGPLSAAVSLILMTALASMRPRFMNRGSERAYQHDCVDRMASARASRLPRFMNRGLIEACWVSCPLSFGGEHFPDS